MAVIDPGTAERLRDRAAGLRQWLSDEAPYAAADQRHLDENTPERAYWHAGYLAALADVLKMTGVEVIPTRGSGDKSN